MFGPAARETVGQRMLLNPSQEHLDVLAFCCEVDDPRVIFAGLFLIISPEFQNG
jgi:hypothetical protein